MLALFEVPDTVLKFMPRCLMDVFFSHDIVANQVTNGSRLLFKTIRTLKDPSTWDLTIASETPW